MLILVAAVAGLAWWGLPSRPGLAPTGTAAPGPESRLTSQATLSTGVVQLMVTGNAALARNSAPGLEAARRAFEQAVALDERYAPAHAGLTQALALLAASGIARPESVLPSAITHGDRAIELDASNSLAWQGLAQAEVQWKRDWPRAEMHYRRALSLDPHAERPAFLLAQLVAGLGRGQEAIEISTAALGLRPESATAQTMAGVVHWLARGPADALGYFERAAQLDAPDAETASWLALTLAELGRVKEAEGWAAKAVREGEPPALWLAGYLHARAGRAEDARHVVSEMDEQARRGYVPAIDAAYVAAALGDKGRALERVEAAVQEHSRWVERMATDPLLASLRQEPRFLTALASAGLRAVP